jgi:hypothetical protein
MADPLGQTTRRHNFEVTNGAKRPERAAVLARLQ